MGDCCALCLREGLPLTRHHLIPRREHRRSRVRKSTTREEREGGIILVCRDCHNQLHAVLSLQEMAEGFNTLEALLEHPEIARYVAWIRRRQPRGRVSVRRK